MKKLFLSLIFLTLAGSVYAQLNTFSDGDIVSAEKMNENFDFVLKNVRSTTVDCDAGETINAALTEGYNDITIFGTCNEEIVAMSLFDGTAIGRQERFPSEPVGHIIITGGEPNRGAVLASQVSSAFQASLQLRNLTVTNRISVFANSFLFMKDVTHDIAPENEGTLRVAENSVVYIQESDLNEQITLNNSSTVLIQNVDLDVSSEGPFISVEKNSVLELNDVKITHSSAGFNLNSIKNLDDAEMIVFAQVNSSISVRNSHFENKNSAAFIIDQGSQLQLRDSEIISDSPFSVGIIGSQLEGDNLNISNTSGQPLVLANRSYGILFGSSVTGKALNGSTITVEGKSFINILEGSTIIAEHNENYDTSSEGETIYVESSSTAEIEESTVENRLNSSGAEYYTIHADRGSDVKIRNSKIKSSNSILIKAREGSNVFMDNNEDSPPTEMIRNTGEGDVELWKRSSLFLGMPLNLKVDCFYQSSVFKDHDSDSMSLTGCLTD